MPGRSRLAQIARTADNIAIGTNNFHLDRRRKSPARLRQAGERSAFDERYRNAMLHVHFADTARKRGVRRTLRPLFDALMRLPAGLQGPSLEDQLTRVDGVQY